MSNRDPCYSFRLCNASWLLYILYNYTTCYQIREHSACHVFREADMEQFGQNFISETLEMILASTRSELEAASDAGRSSSFLIYFCFDCRVSGDNQ